MTETTADIFESISSEDMIEELERRGDLPDIDSFSTRDLIDELDWRGEKVNPDLDDYHDDDLVGELQDRDYTIYGGKLYGNRELAELFTTYRTMSPEFFEKELKKYFRQQLDVNIY